VVQRYGFIDSNLVKNFRNRLTAAALRLWNAELGDRAVTVEEYPWLSRDVPYTVYFGLALLPMTVFLAASILGAVLTGQEFELRTIVEYRLAPASPLLILGARLTRLVLTALIAAGVLLVASGLSTGVWPDSLWGVGLILLPVATIAGCLGILAGLAMRKVIPAFLVGLVGTFVGWIMGSAFGLAAGFSGWYERISRLTPFTHAVELLFPLYYGAQVGRPLVSVLFLAVLSVAMMVLTALVYRWRLAAR
jgi:ABC-type multidrug transport system permease subunit